MDSASISWGLYDVDTMNEAARALRGSDPSFLLYGEGWTGGLSTLPDDRKAIKANAVRMPDVAFFQRRESRRSERSRLRSGTQGLRQRRLRPGSGGEFAVTAVRPILRWAAAPGPPARPGDQLRGRPRQPYPSLTSWL